MKREHRPQHPEHAEQIRFQDLALAATYLYEGWEISAEPPDRADGFVTFLVDRSPETERIAQDYVTGDLRVDPRRFYDALGIAKRIVHRARERRA